MDLSTLYPGFEEEFHKKKTVHEKKTWFPSMKILNQFTITKKKYFNLTSEEKHLSKSTDLFKKLQLENLKKKT